MWYSVVWHYSEETTWQYKADLPPQVIDEYLDRLKTRSEPAWAQYHRDLVKATEQADKAGSKKKKRRLAKSPMNDNNECIVASPAVKSKSKPASKPESKPADSPAFEVGDQVRIVANNNHNDVIPKYPNLGSQIATVTSTPTVPQKWMTVAVSGMTGMTETIRLRSSNCELVKHGGFPPKQSQRAGEADAPATARPPPSISRPVTAGGSHATSAGDGNGDAGPSSPAAAAASKVDGVAVAGTAVSRTGATARIQQVGNTGTARAAESVTRRVHTDDEWRAVAVPHPIPPPAPVQPVVQQVGNTGTARAAGSVTKRVHHPIPPPAPVRPGPPSTVTAPPSILSAKGPVAVTATPSPDTPTSLGNRIGDDNDHSTSTTSVDEEGPPPAIIDHPSASAMARTEPEPALLTAPKEPAASEPADDTARANPDHRSARRPAPAATLREAAVMTASDEMQQAVAMMLTGSAFMDVQPQPQPQDSWGDDGATAMHETAAVAADTDADADADADTDAAATAMDGAPATQQSQQSQQIDPVAAGSLPIVQRTCKLCGAEESRFVSCQVDDQYCSETCRTAHRAMVARRERRAAVKRPAGADGHAVG